MIKKEVIAKLIESGDHWRAKEILRSEVALKYSPSLYELYGTVLLKMHDKLEAGKYLFLSGARSDQYKESIEIFVERFTTKGEKYLIMTFPKAFKNAAVETLPHSLLKELKTFGYEPRGSNNHDEDVESQTESFKEKLFLRGCAFVALLATLLFVVGVLHGFRVAWRMFVS